MGGLSDLTQMWRVTSSGVRGATSSGILKPANPAVAVRITKALRTWGTGPALGFCLGEARRAEELAVIDVDDPLHPEVSFVEIEHRCNALARGLMDRGVSQDSTLALLGWNSRAYAEVIVAASRIGADLVYLDPSWSAERIAAALAEFDVSMVLRNSRLADLVPAGVPWVGTDDPAGVSLLDALPNSDRLLPPQRSSEHVLVADAQGAEHLETGDAGLGLDTFFALLDVLPLEIGATHLVAAPMHTSWGWLHHRLTNTLAATEVLVRHNDPERLLALVDAHEVRVLVAEPTDLARIVALPPSTIARYDSSSLACVAVTGELPSGLADTFQDQFGEILYSAFGTGRTAVVSVAGPDDLRAAPGTAGRVLPGVQVRIEGPDGEQVKSGETGEIVVRTREAGQRSAEGGSTDSPVEHTGRRGRLDSEGRLTVLHERT